MGMKWLGVNVSWVGKFKGMFFVLMAPFTLSYKSSLSDLYYGGMNQPVNVPISFFFF